MLCAGEFFLCSVATSKHTKVLLVSSSYALHVATSKHASAAVCLGRRNAGCQSEEETGIILDSVNVAVSKSMGVAL